LDRKHVLKREERERRGERVCERTESKRLEQAVETETYHRKVDYEYVGRKREREGGASVRENRE
jgi:hypothetical protein